MFLKIIFHNVSKFSKFQRDFSKFLQCVIPRFETIFWPVVQLFVFLLFSRLCNISLPGSGYYTQLHNWPKTKKSTNFGPILSKMVSKYIKIALYQLKKWSKWHKNEPRSSKCGDKIEKNRLWKSTNQNRLNGHAHVTFRMTLKTFNNIFFWNWSLFWRRQRIIQRNFEERIMVFEMKFVKLNKPGIRKSKLEFNELLRSWTAGKCRSGSTRPAVGLRSIPDDLFWILFMVRNSLQSLSGT